MLSNSTPGADTPPQTIVATVQQNMSTAPEGYDPFTDSEVNPSFVEPDEGSMDKNTAPAGQDDCGERIEYNPVTGKPKRHRRTKAEMQAARSAEQASAQEDTGCVTRADGLQVIRKLLKVRGAVGRLGKDSVSDISAVTDDSFRYRSLDGILSAVNPVLEENDLMLAFIDDVVQVADGYVYVKSRAQIIDAESGEVFSTTGWAREDFSLDGKWAAQITGSCSTYARKYALMAMFGFSGGADPDSDVNAPVRGCGVRRSTSAEAGAVKTLLAPGTASWPNALREAMGWQGTAEELEMAIKEKFEISDESLAILLHRAGANGTN